MAVVASPTPVQRWERRTEVPLILLALAFLVAYAWPVLDPRIDHELRGFLGIVSWTVWLAFAVDFAIRLHLAAGERKRYALTHWYDVALVVLPVLRPLRLLRLLAFVRILDRSAAVTASVATWILGRVADERAERERDADEDARLGPWMGALGRAVASGLGPMRPRELP